MQKKLTVKPLKREEAISDLLNVKPPAKEGSEKQRRSQTKVKAEGEAWRPPVSGEQLGW